MEKSLKISVIIPVYNGEKYIAQCIENILCQTYKNLDIIVIDDGSSDNSSAIAERYPIQVLHQENQGVSVSRNRGIEAATGEYIHFMDVDDWINLDYYANMVEAISLTNADMACCNIINETSAIQEKFLFSDKWVLLSAEDKFGMTNVYEWGYSVRYLFKKSFLEEKKLRFEAGRIIEDLPFSLQAVYQANKIVTVPNAIYYYKKRSESLMNTSDRTIAHKRKKDRDAVDAFRKEFVQKHNINNIIAPILTFEYKIFGIPLLKKKVYNNRKTRWYIFGAYFLQQKIIKYQPEFN